MFFLAFFLNSHYLPSPFYYDKSDVFKDFINVVGWAQRGGEYSVWNSVYPPMVFDIIRLLIPKNLNFENIEFGGMQYPIIGLATYFLVAVVATSQIYFCKSWENVKNRNAWFFLLLTSFPLLFTIERGNFILFGYLFAFHLCSNNRIMSGVAHSLLFNLKPYTVAYYLYYLKFGYKAVIQVLAFALGLFIIFAIMNPDFSGYIRILYNFQQNYMPGSLRETVSYANSLTVLAPLANYLNGVFGINSNMISAVIILNKILIIFFIIYVTMNIKYIPRQLIYICLTYAIACFDYRYGGYLLLLSIPFIPAILDTKKNGVLLILYLIQLVPFDIPIYIHQTEIMYSAMAGFNVAVNWSLGLIQILRPVLSSLTLILLATEAFRYVNNRAHVI